MPKDHERFMRLALEEAARSGAAGNAAVGSLIVQGDSSWGDYTMEKLIELAKRSGQITVVTGILTQECADIRQVEGA